MKVVHLSASDSGGAGTAAYRQHKALTEHTASIQSQMLVASRNNATTAGLTTVQRSLPRFYERYLRKLGLSLQKSSRKQMAVAKLGGDYEIYSLPYSQSRPQHHAWVQNADLINLHWVAGYIDYQSFFKTPKKPLVWTLHDMHPFLGGFHYRKDHEQHVQLFASLENEIMAVKRKALSQIENLTVVCPSNWLLKESQGSELLGSFRHEYIPYSLPLNEFSPRDKKFSRAVLGLPLKKRIVLFVSQSLTNKRKGFHLLQPILEELNRNEDVICAAVGNPGPDLPSSVYTLGAINDSRLLSMAYSAADLFVMPSLEDNLPNVMLESLACGTPVLAGNFGGMKDTIKNGFNGMLLNQTTSKDYFEGILEILNSEGKYISEEIRQDAVERFHPKIQASRYEKLYTELI